MLIRRADEDLFSLGTAEARSLGLREASTLTDTKAFTAGQVSLGWTPFPRVPEGAIELPEHTGAALVLFAPAGDALTVAQTGAEIHRLRAALAADGYVSAWLDVDASGAVPLPPGAVPLGVLAIGHP